MGQVEELEARRAKLAAKLAEVSRQAAAARQAADARRAAVDRKADARRKIILGGAVLALLRSNPAAAYQLRRSLPPLAAERDRLLLLAVFDDLGAGGGDRGKA